VAVHFDSIATATHSFLHGRGFQHVAHAFPARTLPDTEVTDATEVAVHCQLGNEMQGNDAHDLVVVLCHQQHRIRVHEQALDFFGDEGLGAWVIQLRQKAGDGVFVFYDCGPDEHGLVEVNDVMLENSRGPLRFYYDAHGKKGIPVYAGDRLAGRSADPLRDRLQLTIYMDLSNRSAPMTDATQSIHHTAADGYTTMADKYVRGRPDYPPGVADWLRDSLGLRAGITVVDLGAGTGKFTRRLIETGAKVIAVEPVPKMRGELSAALPHVEALSGSAQSIPLPDASVDAVVCAQSFHWFATAEALAEIHRVLKPGGKLGLVWNMRDARVPWVARLDAIVNQAEGDTPRYYTGAWRKVFPFKGFGPLHEEHFSHGHTGAPEDVIMNRVRSVSFIATLPAEGRAKIDDQLSALIAVEPELNGREVVTLPYETAAFYAVKDTRD